MSSSTRSARTFSLDEPPPGEDGAEPRSDSVAGPAAAPLDELAGRRDRSAIEDLVAQLEPDERLLLRLYFLEGVDARGVLTVFGLRSRDQVYRRVSGLIDKLRTGLRERGVSAGDLPSLVPFDWCSATRSEG